MKIFYSLLTALLLVGALGCEPGQDAAEAETRTLPPLTSHADSVAMRLMEGHGGLAPWDAVHFLRFDFGFAPADGEKQVRARHLWDRRTGRYRLEWAGGTDTTYVALFDVSTPDSGRVYLDGTPLEGEAKKVRLQQAHQRFINDTYWLLAPLKVLDEGVTREYVDDSSDAATDVLHLAFQNVGLTPGDQYWLYVDKDTGRLRRWAYVLQGNPDAAPRSYDWAGYEEFPTAAGPVALATRKEGGTVTLYTDNLALTNEVDETLFAEPTPQL